ncbi:MAG: hypothetical protein V1732_01150, partial [Patescibacteria group bacterium]
MRNIDYDLVAITHRLFNNGERKKGGFDKIVEFFSVKKNKKILLIEHPLRADEEGGSQLWDGVIVSSIEKGELKEIERIKMPRRTNVLNWINEVIFNIKYINNHISNKPILLVADP